MLGGLLRHPKPLGSWEGLPTGYRVSLVSFFESGSKKPPIKSQFSITKSTISQKTKNRKIVFIIGFRTLRIFYSNLATFQEGGRESAKDSRNKDLIGTRTQYCHISTVLHITNCICYQIPIAFHNLGSVLQHISILFYFLDNILYHISISLIQTGKNLYLVVRETSVFRHNRDPIMGLH